MFLRQQRRTKRTPRTRLRSRQRVKRTRTTISPTIGAQPAVRSGALTSASRAVQVTRAALAAIRVAARPARALLREELSRTRARGCRCANRSRVAVRRTIAVAATRRHGNRGAQPNHAAPSHEQHALVTTSSDHCKEQGRSEARTSTARRATTAEFAGFARIFPWHCCAADSGTVAWHSAWHSGAVAWHSGGIRGTLRGTLALFLAL